MVERLKNAIEKARAQREAEAAAPRRPGSGARSPAAVARDRTQPVWDALGEIEIPPGQFARARIVTQDKSDLAHIPFDLLRTRLLKVFRDNGWSRIAITSPTKGCGKTLVSANLAFSFARQTDLKTLILDIDLKAPELAHALGQKNAPPISWMLSGRAEIENSLKRYGPNLAIGLNGERVRDSTELIQDENTGRVLTEINEKLRPDAAIYDLPPMLVSDDAIAFVQHVDCVLLVVASGQTTAKEIEHCERIFTGHVNFLGVLLNKAQDEVDRKAYEYS